MLREDGGPWMHGVIKGQRTDFHDEGSYRVSLTKTGHGITRTKKHIKPTDISTEDYLQNEMAKANETN